ncbi:lycopene beta-cyclase [Aquiflexum balticum DSM 16537]|uniref:Lycopene beta-cyclase n=1 Tax=Aquiflexum balticum DSM 16537 TaxID=758820 RepID=A0A1W2H8E3_9BACT|nr:lycopene cyclase family protein [Aquiflexum balticum]SMD44972.1 lycopene beta-cyclase [Aquiflexum balticum DSM 16537]
MDTYDYIVTGLGCSGLSLVYYLLDSHLRDKKILLIDNSSKTENDRTWCYWAEKPLDIHPKNTPLIFWDSVRITDSNNSVSSKLQNLNYYHIKSSDFYLEVLEKIKLFPNVSFLEDRVLNIEGAEQGPVTVSTLNSGDFRSTVLFNSIPFTSPLKNIPVLKQVFVGWKISCEKNCFNPKAVSLMHFVSDQKNKTDFFYTLPYNENEALVEYTLYTKEEIDLPNMEAQLRDYLQNELKINEYVVTFKESGTIPMTTLEVPSSQYSNIIHLGTLAGCSKPSTGYTFYDIQKHCKSIVKELTTTGKVNSRKWDRKRGFKFYDNIILNIAVKWPNALPSIFSKMFENNRANVVLKFLSEETSLWEEIGILSRLKFAIFIKSLLSYEKH